MAIGDVIVGIDIGASKISLVVGEVNNFNQIEVICNTSTQSNGIQKSKIVDENALAESISEAITDAEKTRYENQFCLYYYSRKICYDCTK